MATSNPKYRVLDGDNIVAKAATKAAAIKQANKHYYGTGVHLVVQKWDTRERRYINIESWNA